MKQAAHPTVVAHYPLQGLPVMVQALEGSRPSGNTHPPTQLGYELAPGDAATVETRTPGSACLRPRTSEASRLERTSVPFHMGSCSQTGGNVSVRSECAWEAYGHKLAMHRAAQAALGTAQLLSAGGMWP